MSKPIGVTIIGALLISSGASAIPVGLISLTILGGLKAPYVWVVGFLGIVLLPILGFFAIRVGRGLLRNPAINRLAGERALWACIPVLWLALALVIASWETGLEGLTVVFASATALVWSVPLVGAAIYMRSKRVRAYFDFSLAAVPEASR